jgi:hypothetical protein
MSHLELFHIRVSQYAMYKEEDGLVDELLHDMATERIVHISKYREEQCDGDRQQSGGCHCFPVAQPPCSDLGLYAYLCFSSFAERSH